MRSVTNQPADRAISPELALVDPELAQLARSRLPQPTAWSPSPRPAVPRAVPAAALRPPWTPRGDKRAAAPRRPLSAAAGVVGAFATAIPVVLLGAIVVGMIASEVRAELVDAPTPLVSTSTVRPPVTRTTPPQPATTSPRPAAPPRASVPARTPPPKSQPAARPAPVRPKAPAPAQPPPVSRTSQPPKKPPAKAPAAVPAKPPKPQAVAPARAPGSWIPTKAEIEARTLVLIQERVALWVPPELLDKKTNLLVNNVHAACRRIGRTPRFDCRLDVEGSRGGWLLTAVAAKDGSVRLTWRGRTPAR